MIFLPHLNEKHNNMDNESLLGSSLDEVSMYASVLYIEDDLTLGETIQQLLALEGIHATLVTNVQEALDHIATGYQPDALLIDESWFNGEIGETLKQRIDHMTGKVIPTVIMTVDPSRERLAGARAQGYRLLHKPVDADTLLLTLQQLLSKPYLIN